MEVEDITRFIMRYNIDTRSRKVYYTHNRMYCYAILFHIHNWSLSRIGRLFNTNHATVQSALKKADYVQHYDTFLESTQLIQSMYYFIIPKYIVNSKKHVKQKKEKERYRINMEVSKQTYIEHLKGKDPDEIYEAMWLLTLDKLNTRITRLDKD